MNSFFNPADKLSERRAEMESCEIYEKMNRKVYFLCVDFVEKDLAKKNGCKFDRDLKLWYCDDKSNPLILSHSRVDLDISYENKDKFKALGAKFCPINKVWYGKSGNTELMKAYKEYKDELKEKVDKKNRDYENSDEFRKKEQYKKDWLNKHSNLDGFGEWYSVCILNHD
jgi:hypothetical protein